MVINTPITLFQVPGVLEAEHKTEDENDARSRLQFQFLLKISNGLAHAGFKIDFGLPTQQAFRSGDIRLPDTRVVYWKRPKHDLCRRTSQRQDFLSEVENRHFRWIPYVNRLVEIG